ncbi:hypothetical protein ACFRIC_30885 [Streptomyces sp. NPDC056738]|uniref:hypothetical protein n=1 Tax=Streptomyces sp. NPDC056738 TaxID=3345933 RepID=UPI003679E26A
MSRGEQTPGPPSEDVPAVPGEPDPRFTVVISGDGSAAIDGEPVPSTDGVTVDAAILDALHGYARDRGTTVSATISDPSAGYVAHVEVAPDGSSTLVDQREEPPPPPTAENAQKPGPSGLAHDEDGDEENALAYDAYAEDEDEDENRDNREDDGEDEDDDDFDVEAYTLEQQRRRESLTPPPPPPPLPASNPEADADPEPPTDAGSDLDLDQDPAGEAPGFAAASNREAGFGTPAPQLVRRAGSRQSDDEYRGPGLLHRPLVVGPVALVAAALVIVPLVMLGSGGSDDGGGRTEAARSTGETSASPQAERSGPVSTSTASVPPPSPSTSPSPGPKESKGAKKGSKGSGGTKDEGKGAGPVVTVTARPPRATVTARPAQDTAATAVNRLARNDPSGRHICYRAYVSGQGWQKPVCDGTMAGTSGRNNPIKALNIAVSGGGGSAANAFVHDLASTDGRGTWEPRWTAVIADGRNNYIGSTKKSAPRMSGFAINIGSGRVCQTAKVHGFDWGAQGCADARPGYVFGGALENDRWLEAVKFTL